MADYIGTKEAVVRGGDGSSNTSKNQTFEEPIQLRKYAGTHIDKTDMKTLGKIQELRRNFRFSSIVGFSTTLQSSWEFLLVSVVFSLINGGLAGTIWGFVLVAVAYILIYASLSEVASMAPTAGGQYHWVSELAPRGSQKYLSYITGWLCFLGWQANVCITTFLAGTVIQGLLVLNYPDYVFRTWHGTLLTVAVVTVCVLFNTFLAKRLPMVEGVILIFHIFGFFAIMIPLWVLGPRQDASIVFTQFQNGGGWSTTGLSFMVGLLTSTLSLASADSVVHMAEEIKDASLVLPRSIMTAVAVNFILGFVMLITFCFTLGDLNSVLATSTGYPFIQVFYNITNSLPGTNAMTSIIIVTLIASSISAIATASRQLWSFARDKGLPASGFLSHVYIGWKIPLNAVVVTWLLTVLLSLINIGSSTALNTITSLGPVALLGSYMILFVCLIRKRLLGEPLPLRRWSLGRFGMPINIAALCFCPVLFVFIFFPVTAVINSQDMNYNITVFSGVVIFATVYYFAGGRHSYVAPVLLVKRDY